MFTTSPETPTVRKTHDCAKSAVPLAERRGQITMTLLWTTMVTAFPTVLAGVEFYKAGLTLGQVLLCTIIACLILLAYAVPANYLGARSGLTYGLLTRRVFGNWGSRLVTVNLNLIFIAWYGLISLLLADALVALFKWQVETWWLAALVAMSMAFNNFFGFKGVANFARFLAAPVLIGWVAYTFFKTVPSCSINDLAAPSHTSFGFALSTVTALVIGYGVWGNEPDYWRYSKPSKLACLNPVLIALLVGQVIFPATGWMIARLSGITDYAAATAFMTDYSFGGIPWIAAAVLLVSYFAINDSNLYGATNALGNLLELPHKLTVALLALAGAVIAAGLALSGTASALESIASLNCILLPVPTVIMLTEWFVVSKLPGVAADLCKVPDFAELPAVSWPAVIATVVGIAVGIICSGVVPGTENFKIGVFSVQAWLAAAAVYLPLRLAQLVRERKLQQCFQRLNYPPSDG